MAVKQKHLTRFYKGMHRDVTEKFQPEGTYRYALNATLDSEKRGALQSEKGILQGVQLASGQIPIGAQKLDDHKWVIFSTNNTTGDGHINIYDPIDTLLTTIVDSPDWGWLTTHPIKTILKIQNGCDRIIYFTDNLNPYRAINIDDVEQYEDAGTFEPHRTNVSRQIAFTPDFALQVKNGGGYKVQVGTYSFAVAYTDKYGNATNVAHTSQPVPIYQDPIDGNYLTVFGNRNLNIGGTGPDGGVPTVDKSIDITLTNLDTDFHSFKIYSIHTTSGLGRINSVFEHPQVKIESSIGMYTFKGTQDAILSSLQHVELGNVIINKVKAHQQLDGRLYIANLTDEDLDWATIQRATNDITSSWETIGFQSTDEFTPEDCKTSGGYTDYRSYMRDEIYAYGIQGRLKRNGRLTPVFHIPGREEILSGDPLITLGNATRATLNNHARNEVPGGQDWDRQLLTVVASGGDDTSEVALKNVKHLGFTTITDDPYGDGPGQIQRWRVYNTAITNTTDDIDSSTTGTMAFWESTIDYPSQEDCNGDRIYPTGKIRHHKFPDTRLMRHCTNVAGNDDDIWKWPIGIRFDLTAFLAALPAEITDAVEGWEIVRAHRTDADSTVMDKGLIYRQANDLENEEDSPTTFHTDIVNFVSPRTMFDKDWLGSGYLKFERIMLAEDTEVAAVPAGQAAVAHRDPVHGSLVFQEEAHIKINSALYLGAPFPYYGSALSANDGHPNISDDLNGNIIDSGRYSIHQFTLQLEDDVTALGNPYSIIDSGVDLLNSRYTQYCSIKRVNDSVYSNFDNLKYYRISNNANYNSDDLLFGGDCFISRYTYREKNCFRIDDPWSTPNNGTLVEHVVESIINTELRTKGGGEVMPIYISNTYIPNYLNPVDIKDPAAYTIEEKRYQDFLDYNPDYSQTNTVGANVQIASNFDFCSSCLNSYPYRIYYSDKSFQETISDSYRKMSFNSYRDLLGQDGELYNLFVQNDQLYAHSARTTWFLPTRPQQLTTNENTVELGTGDFLSVPPKRLSTPEYAYGGSTENFATTTTEYGTVFVDTKGAGIFLLSESLQDISLIGMKDWFTKNIPLKMNEFFIDEYQEPYPVTGTTSNIGIGFISTYDPELKRVIITKKDFTVVDSVLTVWTGTQWENTTNPGVAINFTNAAFTNEGWTISYSLLDKVWVSFHTYKPNLYWNDETRYYSSRENGRELFHHNHYQYLRDYVGNHSPFHVDFIINPEPYVTKTISSFQMQMDVETYTLDNDTWTNIDNQFFNNMTVYNSWQSSARLRVILKDPFESIEYDPLTIYAFKADRRWNLSDFRDMVTDYDIPLWLYNASSTGSTFRLENPGINLTDKSLFEIQRLRDNWFGCTMYWSYNVPYRISIDSVVSTYSQSFR